MHTPLPKVLFITTLDIEFDAVLNLLKEKGVRFEYEKEHRYHIGNYQNLWHVIVRQSNQKGNTESAIETEMAIAKFSPAYAFLVGVAGGIKDVNLGDVVIAKSVVYYESGKVVEDITKPSPNVQQSSTSLINLAARMAKDYRAKSLGYKVLVRQIASGEKVITSHGFLQKQNIDGDTVAVEMEANGFLRALRNRDIQGIVIRGISDLLSNKTEADEAGWQPKAAHRAAEFAFGMLKELDIPPTATWKHWLRSLKWCALISSFGLLQVWLVLVLAKILAEVGPSKELLVDGALLSFSIVMVSSLGIDYYYFAPKELLPLGVHFKIVALIRKVVFIALPFTIMTLSVFLFITHIVIPNIIKEMGGAGTLEWVLISATLVYAFFVKLVMLPEYRGDRQ